MKRHFIFLLLLLVTPIYSNLIDTPTLLKEKVEAIVKEEMKAQNLPGFGVAIVYDGKPVLVEGYGYADINARIPFSPATRFAVASCSKAMTAFVIMMLVQEGKIKLDDSIRQYLKGPPPSWQNVTISRLLSHTSGIPKQQGPHLPWENLWMKIAKRPFEFPPGAKFQYNNFNFIVLSRLIEVISGRPFAEYMQERLFGPLQMTDTGIPHNFSPAGLAKGYFSIPNGGIAPAASHQPWEQAMGSGGVVSSLNDLIKWDQAMAQGKFLNAEMYKLMWTAVPLNSGKTSGWGLGWQVNSPKPRTWTVSKEGGIPGYRSIIVRHLATKISIILLTNTRPANMAKIARRIIVAIHPLN